MMEEMTREAWGVGGGEGGWKRKRREVGGERTGDKCIERWKRRP